MIKEVIVVEGRDDTNAIRRAVEAETIETHGFGITEDTWQLLAKAYEEKGLIVFTDPDTAGEQIRRLILERFPDAQEAFLDQSQAEKDGDIGIENASPEAIRQALAKAHGPAGGTVPTEACGTAGGEAFTTADLFNWGLDGVAGAAKRRRELGQRLGIGKATAKTFLQRLNRFGISREEIEGALTELEEPGCRE